MDTKPSTADISDAILDQLRTGNEEKSRADKIKWLESELCKIKNKWSTEESHKIYYWKKSNTALEEVNQLKAKLKQKDEEIQRLRGNPEKNMFNKQQKFAENQKFPGRDKETPASEHNVEEELSECKDRIKSFQAEVYELRKEAISSKIKVQQQNNLICELTQEVRSLEAEKRSILNQLEEKTDLEGNLRQTICKNRRLIHELNEELKGLLCEDDEGAEGDFMIDELETELKGVLENYNQLLEKNEDLIILSQKLEKATENAVKSDQLILNLEKALCEQKKNASKSEAEENLISELVNKLGTLVKVQAPEGASPTQIFVSMLDTVQTRLTVLDQCFNTFKQLEVDNTNEVKTVSPTISQLGNKDPASHVETTQVREKTCNPYTISLTREIVVQEETGCKVPAKKFKTNPSPMTTSAKTTHITKVINVSSDEDIDIEN